MRARPVLAISWALLGVLLGACSLGSSDDLVVDANASDDLAVANGGSGIDQAAELQDTTPATDELDGGEAGAPEAVPGPPTLSPEGQAALATSSTAPTTTEPATSSETPASTAPTSAEESTSSGSTSSSLIPPGTGTVVSPADEDLAAGEERSLNLLNELRASLDLGALSRDGEMDAFAREWSQQMAETGDFSHSLGPYGENIAFTSDTRLSASEAAEVFHDLWQDSPGHYRNMTNNRYTKAGIGLYLTERGWYGTHVFQY